MLYQHQEFELYHQGQVRTVRYAISTSGIWAIPSSSSQNGKVCYIHIRNLSYTIKLKSELQRLLYRHQEFEQYHQGPVRTSRIAILASGIWAIPSRSSQNFKDCYIGIRNLSYTIKVKSELQGLLYRHQEFELYHQGQVRTSKIAISASGIWAIPSRSSQNFKDCYIGIRNLSYTIKVKSELQGLLYWHQEFELYHQGQVTHLGHLCFVWS